PEVTFLPDKKQLEARVTGKLKLFAGPPAPVELSLVPERIPGLKPAVTREGVYRRLLSPGKTVTLTADKLEFAKDRASLNGLVFLNVDGYKHAFVFKTTFLGKDAKPKAEREDRPIIRLDVPRYWSPVNKLPVAMEVDPPYAASENLRLELALDRT